MPTNKEIVAGLYASFAKGDVPSVLAGMDPKIEWTETEGWRTQHAAGCREASFGGASAPLEVTPKRRS